jgi:hypothetical protein
MKIEIESLDELKALFNFFLYGPEDVPQPATGVLLDALRAIPTVTKTERSDALDVQEENAELGAGTTFDEANPADGQKPKRTRRTKEQIAADNAASETPTHADGLVPINGVEPATVAANSTAAAPAPNAAPPSDIEHLKLCREFISTHGMAKYEQSFIQAGLASNIMAFSDADRAKHVLALDKIAAA